jgi:hypothetical protein
VRAARSYRRHCGPAFPRAGWSATMRRPSMTWRKAISLFSSIGISVAAKGRLPELSAQGGAPGASGAAHQGSPNHHRYRRFARIS